MAVTPNPDQFARLAADAASNAGEVVMLNLLRFARGDGGGHEAGAAEYARYSETALRLVEDQGGRVLWMGRPDQVVIGDERADAWDAVALVMYPSRAAFIEMVSSERYLEAHRHREAGLEATVLLAMTPGAGFSVAPVGS